MWSWFGGASAQQRKDAPKNAILGLREQLDMLQKREKHLENQMAEQDALAKKYVSTNKNAAKNALRRKKVHEKSLEQTTAQILQLESQIYSIEAANINQETLAAMKNAGKAMKQIHKGMSIEMVDQTMDELREQQQLSEEIVNAVTSAPLGGEPIDEDDLQDELDQLEQEAVDERMLKTGTVPVADRLESLPAAAKSEPKGKSKAQEEEDEEAELEKLRAEMAM
ncbi:vacuolar-sorting protein SNF7 [Ascosphaera apis ARSEF 7405]|uniref:Vacuolar-sorting protein SNF7 n=1 Tax=Ascosphaera apis ARSEF 7405 TaxID=392613 RepID=A0A168CTJ0_9EURO|nr:vacuolar-sorting protein SNF7 [Ascosphaera apis ARSEF 7405]